MSKILLFISFLCFTSFQVDNTWRDFISYEGEFKVKAPGEIKELVNSAETTLGTLDYHIFFYRNNDKEADNLMYMVSYCDYPEGSIHSDSIELAQEFLDATIDESVKSVNGKLIYSNDIKVKGFPAKLWRVDYGDGKGVIRTKAFIRGNRFYTVQTACNKNKSLNISSDKFIDSFKLLDEYDKANKPKKKIDFGTRK